MPQRPDRPPDAPAPNPPARPRRGDVQKVQPTFTDYLKDPRSAVLFVLGSVIIIGGGRRIYLGWKARQAVAKLEGDNPPVEDIEAASLFGREGLMDFFRLLGTATDPATRDAAGRALARLWKQDDLIVEEEKALVRRGFEVNWRARKRYPRGLIEPINVLVSFEVPFLDHSADSVNAENLLWSYRITGSQRASLEQFSKWGRGANGGEARFQIDPRDFPTKGPHRLVLEAKVSTIDLTDPWEMDLPHIPFSFEFDPILEVDALLASPDDQRAEQFADAVQLRPAESEPGKFAPLTRDLVMRNPPALFTRADFPSDLAHRVEIEFEGIEGRYPGGSFVVNDRVRREWAEQESIAGQEIAAGTLLPDDRIERPSELRMRAHLHPDPQLGWADPDVRSLWPGSLTTNWANVSVVRR